MDATSDLFDCLIDFRIAAHDVITEWAEGDMTTLVDEMARLRAVLHTCTRLLEGN